VSSPIELSSLSPKASSAVTGDRSHEPPVDYQQDLSKFRHITATLSPDPRPKKADKFCSNSIRTAKYTIFTWAPVSLMMQFRRAANIYFLIISILSFMPFSPKNPLGLAGAFAVVLVMTMFKEGYEDFFRSRSDKEVNNRKTLLITADGEREISWSQVKVGNVLKIRDNEQIPADLFLMKSCKPSGLAFVNTMNLDGETNLKEKFAPLVTKDSIIDAGLHPYKLEVDYPNADLNSWSCNVLVEEESRFSVSVKQLLMRGCVLKNTPHVYGVVVYTGQETKIVMNSKKPPQKSSNIMKSMNWILASVFVFQAFLVLGFAIGSTVWNQENAEDHEYLDLETDIGAGFFFIKALTYLVAYSHLIPISLYVTLEIVKLILARLINQDLNMYDEASDRTALSRTSELIEELGEVDIIFSDKTGTLTANIMKFKYCCINNRAYSAFKEDEEYEYLFDESNKKKGDINAFIDILTVCNSVFPTNNDGNIIYQATSAEELAFVEASRSGGVILHERVPTHLKIEYANRDGFVNWPILAELPFSSDRARMSIIATNPLTNQIVILTKGSDEKVPVLLKSERSYLEIKDTVEKFAKEGLRVFVFGSRVLSEAEFSNWIERWNHVQATNDSNKANKLAELSTEVERDLQLVGAAAIEDKLQDKVPETIANLARANIRLWVLTGDKQSTAIEIGKSCNLIQDGMEIKILSSDSMDDFANKFSQLAGELESLGEPSVNKALVLDGKTLPFALKFDSKKFFAMAQLFKSCICCRFSALQKSQIVSLARQNTHWITLAIGDGANDVSMIQTAHVGIGIMGKEGTQAVQSSDYAIAQFKFLEVLLLFHGRLAYKRVSWYILYYFYKNFALVFTELGFAFMNGFSGQIYFLDLLPQLYNSLWTSWPCIVGFSTDRDVINCEESILHTELYAAGQRRMYFNIRTFWMWVFMAAVHGVICFLVPMYEFSMSAKDKDGLDSGLWMISTVSFNMVIHIVTIKILLETTMWHFRALIVYLASILFFYACVFVIGTEGVSNVFQPSAPYFFHEFYGTPKVWIFLLVVPLIALIPDFMWIVARQNFFPNPSDVLIRESHNEKHKMSAIEEDHSNEAGSKKSVSYN